MAYRHEVTICSTIPEIQRHIDIELKEFNRYIQDEDLIFDLRLVLSELFINACEHGNKWNENKCINYEIEIDNNQVRLVVVDEGKGVSKIKPYDAKSLDSCGRGLKIVKELTDELELKNNMVTAVIYL